jgi:uncharacterized membrane protein
MQDVIGHALRIGVVTACIVAIAGGIYYLIAHGLEPIPDYREFHSESASFTTARGIWEGVIHFHAKEWMQLGVVLLIFTPVMRVFLSLILFFKVKDWLYVGITALVLAIILGNMLEGSLG